MKIILKGIQGLKSLQGLHLFDIKYRVQDLFSDPNSLKKLLKKDLAIDDDAVESVMNANLDLTVLLANENPTTAKDIFCNPAELKQLLNVENSNITIEEISTTLCSISASQAVKASTILLRELALSRIIGNFAKLGIEDLIQRAGLSWDEAVNTINILKLAPSIIPKIKQHISELTKSLDPEFREHLMQLNVTNDGIRVLGTPQALKASGKILCGKPLKTLQDEFNVLQISHSAPQLDKRDLEELPSVFCQHGYEQVMNMVGGPIVWGFFKPILRGKILFSPNNIKTQLIMKELNRTFNSITRFIDILHAWGEGTSGLQYLQKHEHKFEKMKKLIQSDAVQPLISQVIGDDASNILKGFNIASLRNQISNVSGLLDLVQLVGNMSQCFELNRFVGFDNELELEKAASVLHERREFIAAIVFLNINETREKRDVENTGRLPSHIKYKLRMDIDNIPSTRKIRDKFWKPGPRDNFLDELRYFRGFIQLQELVDQAITIIQTDYNMSISASSYMQQFPYPCYEKDE
ncbi:ATP-binding cassette sub-family A member 1-like [Centruroides sculpturatus]|nr:ATP-binding cassette sub-family A member 1-like [Centruroides sculpturatus]